MSWASKPSYPSSALYSFTLKATDGQRERWHHAAKQRRMARGAFIAYCADFYCNVMDAERRSRDNYAREMHPENWRGIAVKMKTASFTVHATALQSARWKQAAEAEGFASVGSWEALALDSYLKARARAGVPVPLAWRKGIFRAILEDGEATVRGYVSPPFGVFYGTPAGVPSYLGRHPGGRNPLRPPCVTMGYARPVT